MVSKLLLALAEVIRSDAADTGGGNDLISLKRLYYRVREGIGVHKSPIDYGAFPLDPYSHTPAMKGVQQPGLTGQVKEDFLSRFMELGINVNKGKIRFDPGLLRRKELDLSGSGVPALQFTCCNVPIRYMLGARQEIIIHYRDGRKLSVPGLELDETTSRQIFLRTLAVSKIELVCTAGMITL